MTIRKHLLLATVLAATSTLALAQTPPAPPAPGVTQTTQAAPADSGARQQRWAERHAPRQAQLKAALQLTAAQEGAWATYTAAMQPPAQRPPRMDRAQMAQLTTPQRIDRMQAMQAERQQFMTQRMDAIKAFYAQLTPEQQKVYDQQAMRHGKGGRHGGGPGMHRG